MAILQCMNELAGRAELQEALQQDSSFACVRAWARGRGGSETDQNGSRLLDLHVWWWWITRPGAEKMSTSDLNLNHNNAQRRQQTELAQSYDAETNVGRSTRAVNLQTRGRYYCRLGP